MTNNFSLKISVVFVLLILMICFLFVFNTYVNSINSSFQNDLYKFQDFFYNYNRVLQEQTLYMVDFSLEHKNLYYAYVIKLNESISALKNTSMIKKDSVVRSIVNISILPKLNQFYANMEALIAKIEASGIERPGIFDLNNYIIDPSSLDQEKIDLLITRNNFTQGGIVISKNVAVVSQNISLIFTNLGSHKKGIDNLYTILLNIVSLTIIASFIAISVVTILRINKSMRIEKQARAEIKHMYDQLELMVVERTQQLNHSMTELKRAQEQLIETEKMSALGDLVAGIAHEVNTPIGIGVTAASYLQDNSDLLIEAYKNGTLEASVFEKYLEKLGNLSKTILANMMKASELIKSFKQVAVDQSGEGQRCFNMREFLHEIKLSLRPKYKKQDHQIIIDCHNELWYEGYAGALSQIFTNLIMNSIIHGFEKRDQGTIHIKVREEGKILHLEYSDNGWGMDERTVKHIYEPFFTTKRGSGGSGLGMHVVYNIVHQKLEGSISCHSEPQQGTQFILEIPYHKVSASVLDPPS